MILRTKTGIYLANLQTTSLEDALFICKENTYNFLSSDGNYIIVYKKKKKSIIKNFFLREQVLILLLAIL